MADEHTKCGCTRRQTLRSLVGASLVLPAILSDLLGADATAATSAEGSPLAPKPPHFPPKAKRVIFLHMSGGVSHVDTFDPKPKLFADHGKQVTVDHPETKGRPGFEKLFLKKPQWEFKKRGESGIEVSELFPHVAGCVDDLAM